MKAWFVILTVCLLSFDAVAKDQNLSGNRLGFAASSAVVPVMANLEGLNGAVFQTQVSIFNPTAFNYSVQVTLYGPDGMVGSRTLTMSPGQIRNYSNFLQDVFAYAGAGAVRFDSRTPDGGSADFQFVLNSEVYWDTANGSYGTSVPALFHDASSFEAYSVGVKVSSAARTNIGCFNDSDQANAVEASVFDASGQLVDTVSMTVAPHSWKQMRLTASVNGGHIRWRLSAPAYCYAVVVDNRTNDGNFIPAAEFVP
ncbi:MAG: hypothetical protein AB1898_15875 [Acidobacteriota bacterium]